VKGPAIFLAQFAGDKEPFNSLPSMAKWAAGLGYKGIQIPTWDGRLFDLKKAAESQDYCDEVAGICREAGVEVTELSTHLQGQLVAVHPAYDELFDAFAAPIAAEAAETEPPLNAPAETAAGADSITPFCKATSNAFSPPSFVVQ